MHSVNQIVRSHWRGIDRSLRIVSGLTIACFLIPHLANHALGLISLDSMEALRKVLGKVWSSYPGWIALSLALIVHPLISLLALWRRSTVRMPRTELAQLMFGLALPFLLFGHVIGTRVNASITGIDINYYLVLGAISANPADAVLQTLLVVVVWAHLCLGLHMWLRRFGWYQRAQLALYTIAVVLPVLSISGFLRSLSEVKILISDPAIRQDVFSEWRALPLEMRELVGSLESISLGIFSLLVMIIILSRWLYLRWKTVHHTAAVVRHSSGKQFSVTAGQSLLDALRSNHIDHASVCGGRARCTTCRVQISDGLEHLEEPTMMEAKALKRIGADGDVRLACQTYPRSDLFITPLVNPLSVQAHTQSRPGGVAGSEREVVALFVDIRGSTQLAEDKLPYDVVFILNRFFSEMSDALDDTDGHYAQFSGDGLLALYGLQGSLSQGAVAALQGAENMLQRVAKLNAEIASELPRALRIGIGIHAGEAIVGDMGPPSAPILTAIGDNINIAARLESLTKEFACQLVVSVRTAELAGVDYEEGTRREVEIRGRNQALAVYAVDIH